jgi:serine phosphatase RsbU (regulator of sigma subunit)
LLLIKRLEGNGENHDILGYIASAGLRVFLSAQGIQDALMADICEFVNDAPQSDDIALAVIVRGSSVAIPTPSPA